jgi:hypothetical protein
MRIREYPRIGLRPLALALLLVAAAGCGGEGSAPVAADEDAARKVLDQALSAWQKGETLASMKQGAPPITVADPSWEGGQALKKFEVVGDGKPSGSERAFTVKLWLEKSKSKDGSQQVVYKVGTSPIATVFRSMF